MPLMAAHAHLGGPADPFMRWSMRVLDPVLSRALPGLYAILRARSPSGSSRSRPRRDGVGGPALLHPRLGRVPPPLADMNTLVAVGTGRRVRPVARRHPRAGLLHRPRRPARRLLRGGRPHHRAHPRRQHARGARQAADVGGADELAPAPAEDRARGPGRDRARSCPSSEVGAGDVIVVRPASGSPSTARSSPRASAVDESMLTGESLPVRSAPAIAVIGATVNRTGAFRYRAPPSAPTACSRRS